VSADKPFDVFLSHNSVDKPWVVDLKMALQGNALNVWLDKDEIRPGNLFGEALEKGIASSKSVALIVSVEAMRSGWVRAEYYRALSLATEGSLQLIPVLLRSAELPGFLKSVLGAAAARDEEVRKAFPDGIIWVALGQEPQLTLRQQDVLERAGGEKREFKDAAQERVFLRICFEKRAAS
jgi:hypothetical protein